MNTEKLLTQLSQDLKPVKRLTATAIFAVSCAALSIYIFAISAAALWPRADLAQIFWPHFYGLAFLPIVLALAALWLGYRSTASSAGRASLPRSILWLAAAAYVIFCYWYSRQVSDLPTLAWSAPDLTCALLIVFVSLPIWLFGSAASAFWLPVCRKYEFALAFAAGAVGALIVNLHCPYEGHGHHFFGHALLPFMLSGLIYAPLSYGSRSLGKKLVALRAKGLLKRIG